MSDKNGVESRCDPTHWATFKDICWREFSLDPDEDGIQAVNDALLQGGGKWDDVWLRFCDAPRLYPGVSTVLRLVRATCSASPTTRAAPASTWNRKTAPQGDRSGAFAAAWGGLRWDHGVGRRAQGAAGLNLAQLGESPYAIALEPLGKLAKAAKIPLGGTTAETMAADYADQG
jgi:hypothetical protein